MPKHQFLVSDLLKNDLRRLKEIVQNADQPRLILSTEGLTNHLYDFPANALAGFRKIMEHCHLTCIVVLRAPETWVRSYYKQCIINPRSRTAGVAFYGTDIRLQEFRNLPRVLALTDHRQLQIDIAEAYGAASVAALHLEDDWMAGFDNIVGLDSSGWDMTGHRANVSPPDFCIEILRQVNAHDLPETERLKWKAALQRFSGSNHTLMKRAGDTTWEELNEDILTGLQANTCEDMVLSETVLEDFKKFVQSPPSPLPEQKK